MLIDKKIPLTKLEVGGGGDPNGPFYRIEAASLYIAKGALDISFDTTEPPCFGETQFCPAKVQNTNLETCLLCNPTGGVEWRVRENEKSIICKVPEDPVGKRVQRISSQYYQDFYTQCDHGKEFNAGGCQSCDGSCSSCDGGTSSDCLSCLSPTAYLTDLGAGKGTCSFSNCPAGKYWKRGRCLDCPSECPSSCLAEGICGPCLPNEKKISGVCCDVTDGHFMEYPEGEEPRCSSCHESCLTCTGKEETHCSSCRPGKMLDLLSGKCRDECQGATYYSPTSFNCEICPKFCQSCTDATTCTSCSFFHSLKQEANGDISCAKIKECPTGCKTCSTDSSDDSCHSCQIGFCLNPKTLTCESKCPSTKFTPWNGISIVDSSKFVFSLEQIEILEQKDYNFNYKVVFSEKNVFFFEPFNINFIEEFMDVSFIFLFIFF